MTVTFRSHAHQSVLAGASLLAALSATALPAHSHTLSVMRVTPGKLSAGDTATVAAKFEFDRTACAVQVDFGDGSESQTLAIPVTASTSDVPLALQHVYARSGAYMVSIVPVADKGTPKCAGGKHSTLIDVLEAANAGTAPEPSSK